jgi:hypothetical protein
VDNFGNNRLTDAPGFPFILGDQNPNIRIQAGKNGWLSESPDQNQLFTQSRTINMTARATVEPFKDVRVQVDLFRALTASPLHLLLVVLRKLIKPLQI